MIISWRLRLFSVMTGTLFIASTSAETQAMSPQPIIDGGSQLFLEGETFTLNCSVPYRPPVYLTWEIPGSFSKVTNVTNVHGSAEKNPMLYNNYTIVNATKEDAGTYTCKSKSMSDPVTATFTKTLIDKPFMHLKVKNNNPLETEASSLQIRVDVDTYPLVKNCDITLNNKSLTDEVKYKKKLFVQQGYVTFYIIFLYVNDTGNYTFAFNNGLLRNSVNFDLRVKGDPTVNILSRDIKSYIKGNEANFKCEIIGYPLPEVYWTFTDNGTEEKIPEEVQNNEKNSLYKITSYLKIPVERSGNVSCKATIGTDVWLSTKQILVYEMPGGFGIENKERNWYSEDDYLEFNCRGSKFLFASKDNITWIGPDGYGLDNVEYSENPLSYVAKLRLNHVTLGHKGNYTCIGQKPSVAVEDTVSITVAKKRGPVMSNLGDETQELIPYSTVNITCAADAVPPPIIAWYKDGTLLANNNSSVIIYNNSISHTSFNSTVSIHVWEETMGTYECIVTSPSGQLSKKYHLSIKETMKNKAIYLSVVGVIFFVLILLVAYLTWTIRNEKRFRKELAAAGLLYWKEGATKSFNPDLGIDEQAELLPYDEKFEFPPERLKLGTQVGAGAFGVVYKAEARGIINAEETTIVAVKMVNKTADNMYIKALASELKIMVHLGKHVNIVNLLGACTKNVGKRELSVIVEYCKFGNIHNYVQKHREVFIDQLTDNPEKTLGKVNRGYSSSSGNSGMQSDYFGSNHTQDTDNTMLNTANSNRSGRKVSEAGYVQPEWRSNYESDYSFDGRTPRPLCSRDLLAWAFQITRGMEYLASRKVLHGDLAARNVLLAEDNVVKICDFGLARSIYKNDEYQKKESSPLPVKWLAIECMTDRIFSTQSDVWSFGIVLWELFSLAKTPYPNMNPQCLLQWLSDGHRLDKPAYADDRLYDVMKRCWEQKPTARPSFSQLQEILGTFLEDNVRNHYVDLNAAYMDMNVRKEGEEDYLAMVSAPDYNNLVTPSPHHYVNDQFFPNTPQLQHDDEGYLQMSPASRQTIYNARPQGNKFDFDTRKLNPKVPEANNYGSELTPMLTLNNVPRSGSESDHEGNSSPYLNMCPRIEEETDEVFETKQNNLKNSQPSANSVTNPTYITFSLEEEKKPQNFTNRYMNVPNVIVK